MFQNGIIAGIVGIVINTCLLYCFLTGAVSTMKFLTGSCHEQWPISEYIGDNWFCKK